MTAAAPGRRARRASAESGRGEQLAQCRGAADRRAGTDLARALRSASSVSVRRQVSAWIRRSRSAWRGQRAASASSARRARAQPLVDAAIGPHAGVDQDQRGHLAGMLLRPVERHHAAQRHGEQAVGRPQPAAHACARTKSRMAPTVSGAGTRAWRPQPGRSTSTAGPRPCAAMRAGSSAQCRPSRERPRSSSQERRSPAPPSQWAAAAWRRRSRCSSCGSQRCSATAGGRGNRTG